MKCSSKTKKFEKRIIWKETPSHQECSTVLGENSFLTNVKNQLTGLHEKCDTNINETLKNSSVDFSKKQEILHKKLQTIGYPTQKMSFVHDLLPKKEAINLGYSMYLNTLQSFLKSQMKIKEFPIDISSLSETEKNEYESLKTNMEELSSTIEKLSFYEGEDEFLRYCNQQLITMMYEHVQKELKKQKEKYGENF